MQEVPLADHQRKAVDRLHNGSILTGGVGTGKSRVAIQYYVEKEAPKDVYVITTAKKRDSLDWQDEAIKHGIGQEGSVYHGGRISVESWNNISAYRDVENAFFIFDEQRLVGSGVWVKSFYQIAKKNNWILLSATPGDTWMDYIPVFVANGFYKNKTDFIREHVVYSRFSKYPKVERYIAVGRLLRHRHALLVDMPYERHTKRHIHNVLVEHDEAKVEKAVKTRWNPFREEPMQDIADLFRVVRRIVNSDPSRARAVKSLSEQHPRLIVFYNFNYELHMLLELFEASTIPTEDSTSHFKQLQSSSAGSESFKDQSLRSPESTSRLKIVESGSTSVQKVIEQSSSSLTPVRIAQWNGHRHDPVPKSERWVYLVQYVAGAEGWNCVDTDAIVFFSLQYSHRIFEQAQGRIDRLNTPFTDLHYYVLQSKCWIDAKIWDAIRKKKKFNEPKTFDSLKAYF